MAKSKGKTARMRRTHNRKYKDSVFVDLFSQDKTARHNFLSLYGALHGTEFSASTELQPIKLERTLYMGFNNDVSCLVDNKIIVLAEHQSTLNENMPLRCLEYVARLYEQIQNPQDKYLRRLVKIPSPEFYVFYNGLDDAPISRTLRLSEAFMIADDQPCLELAVEVININISKQHKLLENCRPLAEYSRFVQIVRKHIKMDKTNGFENAIKECLENDILKDYLQRKSKEVLNMLMVEYDYATDIEVQREEARQEGEQRGLQQGMQQGMQQGVQQGVQQGMQQGAQNLKKLGVSPEIISQATGLTIEEIERL